MSCGLSLKICGTLPAGFVQKIDFRCFCWLHERVGKYPTQPTPEAIDTLNDLELQILQTDLEKIQYDIQQLDQITQQRQAVLQERMGKLMEMFQDAVKIVAEKNLILIKGSIPGSRGGLVTVRTAIKNKSAKQA